MKRIYHQALKSHLSKYRQMAFLMGPRQAGKTTLSLETAAEYPNHFYFNWDNPAERLLFLEGIASIAKQAGLEEIRAEKSVLVFDEIYKFGKLKNFLKGFFDLFRVLAIMVFIICELKISMKLIFW